MNKSMGPSHISYSEGPSSGRTSAVGQLLQPHSQLISGSQPSQNSQLVQTRLVCFSSPRLICVISLLFSINLNVMKGSNLL